MYVCYDWLNALIKSLEGVEACFQCVPTTQCVTNPAMHKEVNYQSMTMKMPFDFLLRAKWRIGQAWKDNSFKEYDREYVIEFTGDVWRGLHEVWIDYADESQDEESDVFDPKIVYCVSASVVWGEFRFRTQGLNNEADLKALKERIKEYVETLKIKFIKVHGEMEKLRASVANTKCACGNLVTVQYDSLGVKCLDCLCVQNAYTSADAERELHPFERGDDY